MRIMGVAFACLLALASARHAAANETPLFRCVVDDVQDALAAPSAPQTEAIRKARQSNAAFTFDTISGVVRWEFARRDLAGLVFPTSAQILEIWQRGEGGNDWVAMRTIRGPASSPLNVLRIRSWQNVVRFSWLDDMGHMIRGRCEAR